MKPDGTMLVGVPQTASTGNSARSRALDRWVRGLWGIAQTCAS